jgi:transcriptional regulator with XRE-family HTH domain
VELAGRLKLSQSFVSKLERGDRRIEVVELRIICGVYGTKRSEFVQRLEN